MPNDTPNGPPRGADETGAGRIHGVTWLLLRDDCVLLERCPKKARVLGVGEWFVPGGKLEEGETPSQALIREIDEEWPGVEVLSRTALPIVEGSSVPPGPRGLFLMRPFVVTVQGRVPTISADGVPLRWVPIAEALASPVLQVRMMVAAALAAPAPAATPAPVTEGARNLINTGLGHRCRLDEMVRIATHVDRSTKRTERLRAVPQLVDDVLALVGEVRQLRADHPAPAATPAPVTEAGGDWDFAVERVTLKNAINATCVGCREGWRLKKEPDEVTATYRETVGSHYLPNGAWAGVCTALPLYKMLAECIAADRAATAARGAPFDKRGADRLAREVAELVRRGVIGSRSPAADALLDYDESLCDSAARGARSAEEPWPFDVEVSALKRARDLVCVGCRAGWRLKRVPDEVTATYRETVGVHYLPDGSSGGPCVAWPLHAVIEGVEAEMKRA